MIGPFQILSPKHPFVLYNLHLATPTSDPHPLPFQALQRCVLIAFGPETSLLPVRPPGARPEADGGDKGESIEPLFTALCSVPLFPLSLLTLSFKTPNITILCSRSPSQCAMALHAPKEHIYFQGLLPHTGCGAHLPRAFPTSYFMLLSCSWIR